jgi:hypothetical protein
MIGHSGYFGCINCLTEGCYENKVIYPFVYPLKTRDHESYVKTLHHLEMNNYLLPKYGIKGKTILTDYIDILNDVPCDYMHLCCEEYAKRF